MCNSPTSGKMRRYLKPEERNTLCDLGYSVKTTFGTTTTVNGYYNYGGTVCSGINVAGINDGINSNGIYTFIGNVETDITISGATILSNDTNATGFECLEDITAVSSFPTTLSATSGTSATTITFNSDFGGVHLLRYVPINGSQKGSITYIYVYVSWGQYACNPVPGACQNLVFNGDFEQNSSIPSDISQIDRSCGWSNIGSGSVDYFYTNLAAPALSTPCNTRGFENDKITANRGYAGMGMTTPYPSGSISSSAGEMLMTGISPLQPNTNYQISFDISLAENYSKKVFSPQVLLSTTNPAPMASSFIMPGFLAAPSIFLTNPTTINNFNGWQTIIFNFTTGAVAGQSYLTLGALYNCPSIVLPNAAPNLPSCTYTQFCNSNSTNTSSFYFVDNVSLVPTNGVVFNLPETICNTQSLSDLSIYSSGGPPNAVFSGTGVTFASGVYSFNPSVAGIGTTTIGYTFTNSSGCSTTLYDTIIISSTSSNAIVVDAINDDFTNMPISPTTGGITTSVYSNDLFNGLPTSSENINNVTFTLVAPISIAGATINSQGVLSIPSGVAVGTYTLNYKLSAIGNCTKSDIATVTIIVADGTITPTIVAGLRANNAVNLIGLQSSNKSIISGSFTRYNNVLQNRIARLNTNLTFDATFNVSGPTPSNQAPQSMAIQSDDKIIVVGSFTGFSGGSNGFGVARLNANGSIDTSFNVGGSGISLVNYVAYTCAIQQDGKILVGGQFGSYNGVSCGSLIRLNSNGSVDTTFTFPNYSSSWVSRVLIQPDGKILVEGYFGYAFTDPTNRHLIRLNSNGTLDSSFTSGYTGPTGSIPSVSYSNVITLQNMALQSDGKIIIVGAFTNYNGTSTKNIIRLLPNGQIDNTFNISNGVERGINDVIIEPSTGKLIIGGEFTTYGATAVKKLIRLNTNGTLDTSFNIGTGTTDSTTSTSCPFCSNYVKALKQQPDGKIIVGGKFTTFNGLSATNITRISGDAGVQAKSSVIEYQSEPEIDTNPNYNSITIYPNPSKGIYTIDFSQEKLPSTLTIVSILGEVVFTTILAAEQQNQIDISNLASGYYIARISNENSTSQYKLIKN